MLRRKGLTLIEVVVATLIVSTVAAGMLAVFVVSRRSVSFAGHRVQALDFARETIERLKGRVGGYLWPSGIPGRADLDAGDHITDALTGDLATLGGDRTYTVEDIDVDGDGTFEPGEEYKRVTVRVQWTEP